MLNGVGGWTIEEAKERMSYAEAQMWMDYMSRKGPLDLGERMEWGFALIATMINRALKGKAEIQDFMPFSKPKSQGASPEQVFSMLKGMARPKVKK